MKPLGPAEIIMPISAPYGVEIPKECQSQYSPDDNEETGEEETE